MLRAIAAAAAVGLSITTTAALGQNLMEKSIAELARMVKAQEVTAVELVETAIAHAKAQAGLNAFITLDEERALAAARQIDAIVAAGGETMPLAGVPIAVKDNINVAGMRTTAGTPGIDFVPDATAPIAARLQAAEAIVVGKTNMHELAFGITSANTAFGAVGNAIDPTKFAGGSSGGTAAAIAAGIVPAGLGSDTGGSVRIPAALNGIVGFRPTTWRYSQEGVVPISATRDVVGPMARSVGDIVMMNAIMNGGNVTEALNVEGLRLGIARPHSDNLSPGVAAAFEAAQARLREGGAELVDIDLSEIVTAANKASFPIALYEVKRDLGNFLARYQPATTVEDIAAEIASPDVKGIFMGAVLGDGAVPEAAYEEAVGSIDALRDAYVAALDAAGLDGIIYPVTPLEAQPIEGTGEIVTLNGQEVPTFPTFIRNTDPSSIYGAPGLSLPIGRTPEGLPVGMELDGRPDGDLDLLAIGLAVEAALKAEE